MEKGFFEFWEKQLFCGGVSNELSGINDIIMNALGVLISSMIFFAIKKMAKALKHNK